MPIVFTQLLLTYFSSMYLLHILPSIYEYLHHLLPTLSSKGAMNAPAASKLALAPALRAHPALLQPCTQAASRYTA
jgi:hypothetical protein